MKRVIFCLWAFGALFFSASPGAADLFEEDMAKGDHVFSRLVIENRCYRQISASVSEGSKNYKTRWVRSRTTENFELWTRHNAPAMSYTFTRTGASALEKKLGDLISEAQHVTRQLGDLTIHEYRIIFCSSEAGLGNVNAEFAYKAKAGEQVDVFEIYLTQIEGSKDPEFAYKNYPATFYLDDFPLLNTYSDQNGYARIYLPRGSKGQLRVKGHAFDYFGRQLYSEWKPARSFNARGGEILYRIPVQNNPQGW